MVSAFRGDGGPCAPAACHCPSPDEVLDPGTLVRLKAAPKVGPFPITEVVTRRRFGGVGTIEYLLSWIGVTGQGYQERFFPVDPSSVFVNPADYPNLFQRPAAPDVRPAEDTSDEVGSDADTGAVTEPVKESDPLPKVVRAASLRWQQTDASTVVSLCGRFRLSPCSGNRWNAFDAWTAEKATGLAIRGSAEAWCRTRLDGVSLDWTGTGDEQKVTHKGARFYVQRSGERFFAQDTRFQVGDALRLSPWFDTREDAQAWCEVRAACEVNTAPQGSSPLVFRSDVPF